MQLYLIAIAFGALFGLVYWISRSLLSPALVFVGVWALTLGVLALAQGSFYQVHLETLAIYLVGAISFCLGCLALASAMPRPFRTYQASPERHAQAHRLLDLLLAASLIGLPFFIRYVTAPIGGLSAPNLLALIRFMNLQAAGRSSGFNLMNNLPLLARFTAFGMIVESDGTRGRRIRAYGTSLLAVVYGLFTGSKEILISIVIIAFFVDAIKRGTLNWRRIVAVGLIVPLVFAGGLLFVNYWWQTSYVNVVELLPDVAWTVELYWLSGVVAFDQVVQRPTAQESRQNVSRIFIETANGFGAKLPLPDLNAEYTQVAPKEWGADMNVYTIYFSYFKDPGWLGMIALMLLAGAGSMLFYKLALARFPFGIVMYGLLAEAAVLSFHGEHYFYNLNQFAKLGLVFAFVYHLPLLSIRRQPVLEAA